MIAPDNPYKFLAPDPDSSYRQLRVKGRRIFARTLYGLTVGDEGRMTPEEVAADYGLPLEAVREAIAYCESSPPEIVEDFMMEEARASAKPTNASLEKTKPEPNPETPHGHALSGRP